jgi:hypothetical protein
MESSLSDLAKICIHKLILVSCGFGAIFALANLQACQEPLASEPVDKVEIRQAVTTNTKVGLWSPLKTMTLTGKIESFDVKSLVIRVTAEDGTLSTKTIASDMVQKVVPAWRGTGLVEAMELFDQRKMQEFSKAFGKLDFKTIPEWQAKFVLAKIVQSRDAANQNVIAGESFLRLANDGAIPELLYADMPLCWTGARTDDVNAKAQEWLKQESEVARLLGASWLLLGQDALIARRALDELQKSKSPVIAQLAKAQSWRIVPAPETMQQLPTWISERDRMLIPISLGPTEFMMDRLMRIGQNELAIGCAVRIATLHTDNYYRSRRALVAANQLLKKQGRDAEADQVAQWIKKLDGTN